ncbi:Chromosome partition protein Smc [Posidoniimonas corsicana]|uniref:Chromosome partition protein Smc n=1 Tax=Posidoniimonas corsicana TaxID=1938618 RepID=A0A5C5VF99_9BACT|nr:c-type cytochrome domain-containing protein [Posidoniimonas corsicana]TWT37338.1 Chromosome partition protein Smc [Posidoniimonas corsicana]
MRYTHPTLATLSAVFCCAPALVADEKITFDQHVAPILRQHCQACHSQDDASGGLALDDYNATLAGGAGGEVLASADVGGSRLWKLVNHEEQPYMPPGGEKIPGDQLKILQQWIEGGLLKDAGSKPKPSAKPAIAAVATDNSGKPVGEPAMPTGLYRQPVVTADHAGPAPSLAASRWAPVVAVPWQRQVSFYHTDTHQLLGIVPYVDGVPQVVRFSRDGSLLLVAGGRHAKLGNAALYDVKSGARLATIGDELDIVLAADISPDKLMVAIGGPKKKVRVYRVADGEQAYQLGKHTDWITALAFSPDGKLIATGDRATGLRTWDAAAGNERNDLRGHSGAITSVAWRADSSVLASTSEDGSVRLWDAAGNSIKSFEAHGGGAMSAAFASDGRIVTAGRDKKVKLWKPDGGHLADLTQLNDIALAAVFTHNGEQVIASDYTGEVRVVGVEDKQTNATLAPNPPTIDDRLAAAAQAVQAHSQTLVEAKQNNDAAQQAVEQGESAHADYQQKLAAAKEAAERQSAKLADQDQSLTAAKAYADASLKAFEAAQKQFATAEKQLASFREEQDADPPTEGDAEASDEAAARLAELEAAYSDASGAVAKQEAESQRARQQADAAARSQQAAKNRSDEANNQLAAVEQLQAGLPNLERLRATKAESDAAAKQAAEQGTRLASEQKELAAELEAFSQAMARLTDEAQQRAASQTEVAQSLGAAQAVRQAAAEAAEAKAQSVAQTKARLDEIKQQLRSLQAEQRELSAALKSSDERLAEIAEQMSEAERQSQIAESQVRDFTAAEAMRKAYAEAQE